MKRWISALLLVSLLLTLVPMTAAAQGTTSARQTQEEPQQKTEERKLIALTFDDGPSNYTAGLLDGLKERGARVTFFMAGNQAEGYPNTVRRVYQEGHEIAQHSYSHPTFTSLSDSEISRELSRTDSILNGHLGRDFSYLLRLPYGDCNSHVMSRIGRPAIFWSVDTEDWKYRNSDTVCQNIVNSAFDGAIVLCHDIHRTTIPGALNAIDLLQQQGYEFVTVSELHRRRGASLDDGYRYYSCKPTGVDYGAASVPTVTTRTENGRAEAVLTADAGTTIYYTTDGTDPVMQGKRYSGPIPIPAAGLELRAVAAYDLNGDRSAELSEHVAAITAKPPKIWVSQGYVFLKNPNDASRIYYTTDGTLPSERSACYTSPFACFDGVLTCQVIGEGMLSEVQTIYVSQWGTLFWDVPTGCWYASEVNEAVDAGIFQGVGEYTFEPEEPTTRAMFVTALYRLMKGWHFDASFRRLSFPDVEAGSWYEDAVGWAAGYRMVNGYEDGTFRPDEAITREEMCVILERFLNLMEGRAVPAGLTFADKEEISDWAVSGVSRMVRCGIIQGNEKNRFLPKDNTIRAEAAAVLLRLRTYLQQ